MKARVIPESQGGFSLLEVLIALTILAVGLLGLALFQVTAIQGNASASDTVAATYYGQDQMERLQIVPYDNLASSPPPGISGDNVVIGEIQSITDSNQFTVSKKGQRYYRVWAVTAVPSTATLKMIRVWVYWWDQRGRPHSVQLVTQRGKVS